MEPFCGTVPYACLCRGQNLRLQTAMRYDHELEQAPDGGYTVPALPIYSGVLSGTAALLVHSGGCRHWNVPRL